MSGWMAALDPAGWWFLPPVCALALGLLALAPLGEQVLARGVVFIDLAVAQAAAAAAVWAQGWLDHPEPWATHALAAAGGLACAGLVAGLARRWPARREALIGLVYVLGASAALLGAQRDVHGREHLNQLLAADLLWAGWPQVAGLALGALAVAALAWRAPAWWRRDAAFYPLFALVASLAVPALGLFVVFACLIAPALWRQQGLRWLPALGGGLLAGAAGLGASWRLDAPSGACVALALAAYGLAAVLRRGPGLPAGRP